MSFVRDDQPAIDFCQFPGCEKLATIDGTEYSYPNPTGYCGFHEDLQHDTDVDLAACFDRSALRNAAAAVRDNQTGMAR